MKAYAMLMLIYPFGTPALYYYLLRQNRTELEMLKASQVLRFKLLEETFAEEGIPFVTTRTDLEAEARASGESWRTLFEWDEPGAGHYNARGNVVAFRAIHRGLRGEFDVAVGATAGNAGSTNTE